MLGGPDNLLNQWCLGGEDSTSSTFLDDYYVRRMILLSHSMGPEFSSRCWSLDRVFTSSTSSSLRVFIKPTLITRHHFYPQDDTAYLWNTQNGGIGVHANDNLNTLNWGSLDQSCMTAGKIIYNPSGNTAAPVIIDPVIIDN